MEVLALILSTAVSIVAISVTAYQTRIQERSKMINFYMTSQLEAYRNLFVAISDLEKDLKPGEKRNFHKLISAVEQAKLLSTHRNADAIECFCAVYIDYISAEDSGTLTPKLIKEFRNEKFILETLLRDEICRYSTNKRKSDKFFKDKRCRKNQIDDEQNLKSDEVK